MRDAAVLDRRSAELARLGLEELARKLRLRGAVPEADRVDAVAAALAKDCIHIVDEGAGRA